MSSQVHPAALVRRLEILGYGTLAIVVISLCVSAACRPAPAHDAPPVVVSFNPGGGRGHLKIMGDVVTAPFIPEWAEPLAKDYIVVRTRAKGEYVAIRRVDVLMIGAEGIIGFTPPKTEPAPAPAPADVEAPPPG